MRIVDLGEHGCKSESATTRSWASAFIVVVIPNLWWSMGTARMTRHRPAKSQALHASTESFDIVTTESKSAAVMVVDEG